MATRITDTHQFYKQLTRAGISEAQAEVIAHERARQYGELATKKDIELLRRNLELLEQRLTIKFGKVYFAGQIASIGIIAGMIRLILN